MAIFNHQKEVNQHKMDEVLIMADEYFAANPHELRHCGNDGQFYCYNDGYYKQLNQIGVERFFIMRAKDTFEPINYYSMSKFKNFIRRYAAISHIEYDDFNPADILNLENGFLHLKTGKFEEHTPEIFSTIRIPYKYDPEATCPEWEKFLAGSLENDQDRINVLQEYMGYCLGRDSGFQKALFLIGEPSAGKGTIIKMIEKMVGQENCAALPLGNMNDENSLAGLVNKLVNVDADVSVSAKDFEADFRRITGSDKITAKILYRDKFSFRPFCKLILAANELPHISDRTRAFFRRMIAIPFNVTFEGREDITLEFRLMNEISGILIWALAGRKRLYMNNGFRLSKDLISYVDDIKRQNNPVEMFFHECIGFHDDYSTRKKDFYDTYKRFCVDNGYHALSHSKLSREFIRWAGPRTRFAERSSDANRFYIWPNVYLKSVNDPIIAGKEKQWDE